MEKERHRQGAKLTEIATQDYPGAEILVSFPDDWEFLGSIGEQKSEFYVAASPLTRVHSTRDQFAGLPPEINVSLVFYRLFKCFCPRPMPTISVDWDTRAGQGRVTGIDALKVQLQPIGQAQAWFGVNQAILWECYFYEGRRKENWKGNLSRVWELVENDLQVQKVFTLPHDPDFAGNYTDFLAGLGYSTDPENSQWWSKAVRPSWPRSSGQLSSCLTYSLVQRVL